MPTRRSFLNHLALAAGSALVARSTLRAQSPAAPELASGEAPPPRLGQGEHTYDCIHDWLVPPTGMVWGDTHGLAQDSQGNIYVAHTVHRSSMRGEAVVVFNEQGEFVRAFGEDFRGGAHGLDLRAEADGEYLYFCDTNRCRTVKTTLHGDVVWTHGYPVEAPAYGRPTNFVPTNIAFAPDGGYYLADGYGSHHILRYDANRQFIGEVGKASTTSKEKGELNNPHGLWVDTRGPQPVLVVADRGNRRLQIFDLQGNHQRTVVDEARLRMPCHFHTRGEWMVCPDLEGQVCILDRDYQVVAQLGDGHAANGKVGSRRGEARPKFTPGKFIHPHDAIFLRNGDILVAEWLPIGRITLLRKVAA